MREPKSIINVEEDPRAAFDDSTIDGMEVGRKSMIEVGDTETTYAIV